MRTIVYDLEIMHGPEAFPDGWEAVRRGAGGVSCVSLYDTASERLHIYDEHDLERCVDHLNEADLLVSFNGIEFDTPCLQGATGMDIHPDQYDILHEVWRALGKRTKGYKLNDLCVRHELGAKNAAGEHATQLYADGRFGKLFDYCMNDVHLTRKLSNFINRYGYVIGPDNRWLHLAQPGVDI